MSITTKDILAVMVVGAVMVFAGISQATGQPLDAGTFGMAGLIVGHYFSAKSEQDAVVAAAHAAIAIAGGPADPLPPPFTGESES